MSNKNRFFSNAPAPTPFGLSMKEKMGAPTNHAASTMHPSAPSPSPSGPGRGPDADGFDFDIDFG
jgi:hypothetical protein